MNLFLNISDSSINAPPSFKPAKKYSDISGLPVSNYHQIIIDEFYIYKIKKLTSYLKHKFYD